MLLPGALLALLCTTGLLHSAAAARSVIHVVVDDLGRADLGFRNNMTYSPTLDAMARGGVILDSHYVFQVCAPTRASIMTGRYPWGIGFYYVGGDNLGVPLQYEMLPQALRRLAKAQNSTDVATVAIGKWHNGALLKAYTPTYRGFESYFGYYHAAVNSYWYHGGEGGGCKGTDLSNSTGLNGVISPANRPDINGTYSTIAFTAEATRIIGIHDVARPLYMYLAYEAVHDAGGSGVTLPVQAPLDQVERYAQRVVDDTYKVQSAMIAVLDEGIANITAALDAKGMLEDCVWIVTADNGGPLDHSYNFPLRGGKHTLWEGGLRGEAFVYTKSTTLLPTSVRGTTWPGCVHTSDWLPTVIEGIFGLKLDHADEFTAAGSAAPARPLDGFNVWSAIATGGASPRTEVISQVSNSFFNTSSEGKGGMAIRAGSMKLLVGYPGDERHLAIPGLATSVVEFGKSGGMIENGTVNHAVAPGFQGAKPKLNSSLCGGRLTQTSYCLFDVSCKTSNLPQQRPCDATLLMRQPNLSMGWTQVVKDPNELHDLSGDPSTTGIAAQLLARLQAAAATAGSIATITDNYKQGLGPAICAQMKTNGGFVEPADALHPYIPPPPGPHPSPSPPGPPAPVPAACETELKAACGPASGFKSPTECLTCTRECAQEGQCGHCKPKDRHAYCPSS